MELQKVSHSGWYKRIFAWLLAHGTPKYDRAVADRKRALFADLKGDVLEIGPGTGINLSYYPAGIHWMGIEPNPFMHPYLQKEAERLGLNIDLRRGDAEQLEIRDNSIDVVISTLVLCSVADLNSALREILRVLKPGGRFIFMEHVAAPPGTLLCRLQRGIRPVWKVVADGCRPDRETLAAIENAGFASVSCQDFRAPVPIFGPHIAGVATKADMSLR
jgi:ubiquinone/menaquinone biosynthesis C-methylase UbiE